MCNCGPDVKIQEYQNQEAVPIPEHMAGYREARLSAGLTPRIAIDRCALPEIRALWEKGIRTYGSCCGHNVAPSMVNVHEDDDAVMVALGYTRWPNIPEGFCRQTFYLKSIPPRTSAARPGERSEPEQPSPPKPGGQETEP